MSDTSSETGKPSGADVFAFLWFETMGELMNALYSDDQKTRLEAAEIVLKYGIAAGQSINGPYFPPDKPDVDPFGDKESGDDDD